MVKAVRRRASLISAFAIFAALRAAPPEVSTPLPSRPEQHLGHYVKRRRMDPHNTSS